MAAAGRTAARLPWAPGNPGCGGPGGCWRMKWPRRWQRLHRCIGPPACRAGRDRGSILQSGIPGLALGAVGCLLAPGCDILSGNPWGCPGVPVSRVLPVPYELRCPLVCHCIPQLWQSHPVAPVLCVLVPAGLWQEML